MVKRYILSEGERLSARAMWIGPIRLDTPAFSSKTIPSWLRGAAIHSYLYLSAVEITKFSGNEWKLQYNILKGFRNYFKKKELQL